MMAVKILTAIHHDTTRSAAYLTNSSAISPKIPATTAAGVFVATSTRWFIAEEAILARFRRTRLIYRQGTIIKGESIEAADCTISLFLRLHCDKAESARLSGKFILDDFDI